MPFSCRSCIEDSQDRTEPQTSGLGLEGTSAPGMLHTIVPHDVCLFTRATYE